MLDLVRGRDTDGANEAVYVYFNLTAQPQRLPALPWPSVKPWFSSEAAPYAGSRRELCRIHELLPHECVAFGPADRERPL